jgi:16S rRNA (cytosine1402-N4)-methyltransferase
MSDFSHQAVLLDEALESLNIRPDGIYIDATFGRGGHSRAILQQLNAKGRLIAFDQDPEAVSYAQQCFIDELAKKRAEKPNFTIEHCNFNQVADVIQQYGLSKKIDGVLMDLGVSSPQLDDAGRGFSFLRSGPLDMRMDTTRGISASDWLAKVKPADLIRVLKKFGEEKFAKRIATAIVETRAQREITETGDLAGIISDAIPVKEKHKHPATRSFQAIRIYINEELQALEQGLKGAASILAVGGRLSVISFHSLEDRIVKRFMRDISSRPKLPAGLPVMEADIEVPFRLVAKPVVAGAAELDQNPRSRSARLRVLERCL